MSVILELALRANTINIETLEPRTIRECKRVILDWLACTISGSQTHLVDSLKCALPGELSAAGVCSIVGDHRKASPRTAALINGTSSHIVEFDDIFRDALYHPGSPVIAAGIAVGQYRNLSGLDFMKAVIHGYEVSTRIGSAVQPAHYKHWHTTGTVGCFGAAAAAAASLGLASPQYAHALATSATFAAGLREAFQADCMSKPLHAGRAAEAGVFSALLAKEGFTGAPAILEGPAGFGVAMVQGDVDWDSALEGLGVDFNIEKVTLKNHGCCGHNFAAIDAILALKRERRFSWKEVEHIEIETYKTALQVVGRMEVETVFEARFSLLYTVAHALVHGAVRLDAFQEDRLHDPAVRTVMDRISLMVNDDLDAAYPGKRGALVRVTYNGGQKAEFIQRFRHGDPEEPLTDVEVTSKFLELTSPVTGEKKALLIQECVHNLEHTTLANLISTFQNDQ